MNMSDALVSAHSFIVSKEYENLNTSKKKISSEKLDFAKFFKF